jgi:xylulokinase
MSLVVGLDAGTQSIKLAAYDLEARRVVAMQGKRASPVNDDGSQERKIERRFEQRRRHAR